MFRVLQFLIYAVIFAALLAGGWLLYVKVQESGTPQWKAPDVHTPDWKWPNWKAPDWKAPNIHMPSWSWPSWGGKTPGPSPAPEPSPAPAPSPHKPEHHKPEHHKKEHHHEMTEEEKEEFWFNSHSEEWKANYLAAHNATGDNSTAVLDNSTAVNGTDVNGTTVNGTDVDGTETDATVPPPPARKSPPGESPPPATSPPPSKSPPPPASHSASRASSKASSANADLAHKDHHTHHHHHDDEEEVRVTKRKDGKMKVTVDGFEEKEDEPEVKLETTSHYTSHHHSSHTRDASTEKSTNKDVEEVLVDASVVKKGLKSELPVVEESHHSSSSSLHSSHHHHHTGEDQEKVVKDQEKVVKDQEKVGEDQEKVVEVEPVHHHHDIASLGEAEESSLGLNFIGLSKPDADYADTFEAAAMALREGTAPKTQYDVKMQSIASAIVALEDELKVSSYQPLLRAFSAGSGSAGGLEVSRLGKSQSSTPLLDAWVETARRKPDRDAELRKLRAAFGTGPKARRAMRIMVHDIHRAR